MIKIYRSKRAWHLLDTHQSQRPFVYDDIKLLIEDLEFLLEGYNYWNKKNV